MRYIIILFIVTTVVYSCSPTKSYYFYTTLNSTDTNLTQSNASSFVLKDNGKDNLLVSYSFTGRNVNLKLSVDNKMSVPIFINWNKSFIKVNDRAAVLISELSGFDQKKLQSRILNKAHREFDLLNSAHFDLMSVNTKKLNSKEVFISDKKLKTKSVYFSKDDSPLSLIANVSFTINEKDTTITNTFFISAISNIDSKTFKAFESGKLKGNNGFYSFFEIDRGKDNKVLDAIFEQVIKTSVHSIRSGGLRNNSEGLINFH